MRIDSSTIGMESARSYSATTAKKMSSVTVTYTGNGLTEGMFGNAGEAEGDSGETLHLEDITAHFRNLSNTSRVSSGGEEQDATATIRQQCMRFLMELLFHFRGVRIDDVYGDQTGMISGLSGNGTQSISKMTSQTYYREEEYTAYSTAGTVRTADGRELSFHLEFGMSRSFEEYYEETYVTSVRDYCDPLVINLDTNVAQVSDQKFFFDLDCDGVQDEISTLNPGSGFLALDLNGDGVINDGGELFGTKSGDGFADLSQYDSDNNGWIDEADPIWDKLLIWTQDENGQDKLYHLADLGVGAIGLANVSTQFALNSQKDNANNAMIRSTGIFLYENGTVSTIQHLDLAR